MRLTGSQINDLAALAKPLGLEVATLAAVISVESNGVIFAPGTTLPIIRWEGHYFYKFLSGTKRSNAVNAGLASPKAGAIKNPTSQDSRYAMLTRGAAIDAQAAYSSISVGVGQVMGSNATSLGYKSPIAMFDIAKSGFKGQVEIMLAFIKTNSLIDELQRKDWSAFARAYNGPNYAEGGYHTKLAAAYKDALADPAIKNVNIPNTTVESANTMLRLGSKGAGVRELQQLLVRAGLTLKVDGDFGPATRDALKTFQAVHGLTSDGIAGPQTMAALSQLRTSTTEVVGQMKFIDIPETTTGGAGTIGGIGAAAAADKINDIADKLGASDGVFHLISNGLYTVGAVLVIGGIVWGAYGWLKSRRTYEGVTH